jgi:hypothetical protein
VVIPRLRPLLWPVEHGGWGFLLEPIVIALVAAPSASAAWLAGATGAAFLARQPLTVVFADRRHRREVARTAWARGIAGAYLLVAVALLAAGAWPLRPWLWRLALLAAPLAATTLAFDAGGKSRRLLPELSGAAALGAVAAAAALAAGWAWPAALALWASALVRTLPAIATVRERVMRLHGAPPRIAGPLAAHAMAIAASSLLAAIRVAPWPVAAIAILLAARAAWQLRRAAPLEPAKRIGMRELATGLAAAAAIGVAWRLTR